MASPESGSLLPDRVRRARLMTGAMILVPLIFLVAVVVYHHVGPQAATPDDFTLTYSMIGGAVVSVLLSRFAPPLVVATQRGWVAQRTWQPPGATTDTDAVWAVYQNQLGVELSLLTATCFLQFIAYIIEGHLVSVAVAVVCLGLMIRKFPVLSDVDRWTQEQLRLLSHAKTSPGP